MRSIPVFLVVQLATISTSFLVLHGLDAVCKYCNVVMGPDLSAAIALSCRLLNQPRLHCPSCESPQACNRRCDTEKAGQSLQPHVIPMKPKLCREHYA